MNRSAETFGRQVMLMLLDGLDGASVAGRLRLVRRVFGDQRQELESDECPIGVLALAIPAGNGQEIAEGEADFAPPEGGVDGGDAPQAHPDAGVRGVAGEVVPVLSTCGDFGAGVVGGAEEANAAVVADRGEPEVGAHLEVLREAFDPRVALRSDAGVERPAAVVPVEPDLDVGGDARIRLEVQASVGRGALIAVDIRGRIFRSGTELQAYEQRAVLNLEPDVERAGVVAPRGDAVLLLAVEAHRSGEEVALHTRLEAAEVVVLRLRGRRRGRQGLRVAAGVGGRLVVAGRDIDLLTGRVAADVEELDGILDRLARRRLRGDREFQQPGRRDIRDRERPRLELAADILLVLLPAFGADDGERRRLSHDVEP